MNIQFNTTNAQGSGQEEFKRNIANSDDSIDDSRRIEKQPSRSQPFQPLEILISVAKNIAKGKNKAKKNGKNHLKDSLNHETHILGERGRRKKMKDMFSKLHALLPQLPPQADQSTIVEEARSSIESLEQTLQKLQMEKLAKLHYSSASSNTTPTMTYDPSASSSPTTLLTPISNHPPILPVVAAAADIHPGEAFLADQIPSSGQNLPFSCNDPIAAFDTWSSRNVVLNICGNEAFFNLCCPKEKSGVCTTVCYLFEKYNIEVLFANVSTNVFRRTYMIQAQVNPSSDNQLNENGIGVGEIFKQVAQELVFYLSSP